jgi:hypothetical protein
VGQAESFFEMLIIPQLVTTFPIFYGTQMFVTVLAIIRHGSLFRVRCNNFVVLSLSKLRKNESRNKTNPDTGTGLGNTLSMCGPLVFLCHVHLESVRICLFYLFMYLMALSDSIGRAV